MKKDERSRKYQITINNPDEKGYTIEKLEEIIVSYGDSLRYGCFAFEIGLEEETPHVHIYLHFQNAKKFSTMKNKFESSHIEKAMGTAQQNRDYVRKEGSYKDTDKELTNLKETFREFGEMPIEEQGKRNDMLVLKEMIEDGYSNKEIIEYNPKYINQLERLDKIRTIFLEDKYKNTFRKLEVTYIYGSSAEGKTRYVMEKYGYNNVYRVTDYEHPFDAYNSQEVIIFEEFRNSLKLSDMLIYLDGYPTQLPARFNNKFACFIKIYIISNIPIEEQYKDIQKCQYKSYQAFMRRIHKFMVFENGEKRYFDNYFDYVGGFNYKLINVNEVAVDE